MKKKYNNIKIVSILVTVFLTSCSNDKLIELPLNYQDGYGNFEPIMGGLVTYSKNKDNTSLKLFGVPDSWTNVKYGDIDTDMYQSAYQNYILGNITEERYQKLQESWNWKPDTLKLSKEPIKTRIGFAFGKDSTNTVKMIVDTNNNFDLSDDLAFTPNKFIPDLNIDSIAKEKSIYVEYERYIHLDKKQMKSPLLILYIPQFNSFMYNFPQYFTTSFKDTELAVLVDDFKKISYNNIGLTKVDRALRKGEKISSSSLIRKGEYIEINGVQYKNKGANKINNTLVLEEMALPKEKLSSPQISYKSPPIKGRDFITKNKISLYDLKGKYVLVDFWATWCLPCLKEMPNLKEIYNNTDREKFEIIGVIGESPSKAIQKIIEKDSLSWPQVLTTESNNIKQEFGVYKYPTSFLINPKGVIIEKDLRGERLRDKILKLLEQ